MSYLVEFKLPDSELWIPSTVVGNPFDELRQASLCAMQLRAKNYVDYRVSSCYYVIETCRLNREWRPVGHEEFKTLDAANNCVAILYSFAAEFSPYDEFRVVGKGR